MPKRKKSNRTKIKDVSEFAGLSNLTGFGKDEGSSLEDCMVEMMFQGQKKARPNDSDPVANATPLNTTQTSSKNDLKQVGRGKTRKPSWLQQSNKRQTSSRTMMNTEDIENWNLNFQTWAKGGIYTPGLLPNIDQEITRNFKVKELSSILLKNELVAGKDLRMPVFERWLLDSKNEEDLGGDSVLPLQSSSDSEASQRLLSELISKQNGVDRADAEKIIAKLCRTTNVMCQELLSQEDRYRRQSPLKNGDRLTMSLKSKSTDSVVSIEYSRKRWKKPFCFRLNYRHYKKLKDRFINIHPNLSFGGSETKKSKMETKLERSFHVLVLALLLRYSALSGGGLLDDLRGGGMQGSIHSSVFEVLQSHFSDARNSVSDTTRNEHQFWFEGFASPFNANLPRFASAFPDLDWHFGSVGRFLDCTFDGESEMDGNGSGEYCEANPPFSPGIMFSMANHMLKALERADKKGSRLTFVVVVPSIDGASKKNSKASKSSDQNNDTIAVAKHAAEKSFRRMISSVYCKKHIQLYAREHGYVEGAQHLRPTQYKQSSYDTSVIILQSRADSSGMNEPDLKTLEKNLRLAFSSRHTMELMERKRKANSTL
jgi:phosphorylated CTD-interacting factor 1